MRQLLPPAETSRVTVIGHGARRSTRRELLLRLSPTARWLSVETDDERIARYIGTAYGALAVEAPPANVSADRAVLNTATAPTTVLFNDEPLPRDGGEQGARKNPWSSGAYLVDQFVWRSLAADADWMSLYGCAALVAGRAVIIVGESGVGKTTLGLALTRHGAAIYGDEMIVVHRRTGVLTAISRKLTIHRGSLELLEDEELRETIRRNSETIGSQAAGILAFNARALGPMPVPLALGAVVIVRRGDGEPRLTPLSTSRTALAVAPYLTLRPRDLASVAELAEMLRSAATYSLTAGRPRETAAALADGLAAC